MRVTVADAARAAGFCRYGAARPGGITGNAERKERGAAGVRKGEKGASLVYADRFILDRERMRATR